MNYKLDAEIYITAFRNNGANEVGQEINRIIPHPVNSAAELVRRKGLPKE